MEEKITNIETEISFILGASGSFEPDYITRMLGIQPTQAKKKGDGVGYEGKTKVRFDIWYVDSPKTRGYRFVSYLLEFLKVLEGKAEVLRNLSEKDSITFFLTAYISIFQETQRPEIQIEKSAMQKMVDLGFTFNIAIYCECCDSEEEDNDG